MTGADLSAWTAPRPSTCPGCDAPTPGPHLCDACGARTAAQEASDAWAARWRSAFPPGLWRAPDGSPWSKGARPCPPPDLVELAREKRLLGAPEVCAAASDWLASGKRTLVVRGCVGALKTTMAAALVLEHLQLGGDAWIVRAGDLARSPDDPTDPAVERTAVAWLRAEHLRALVVLDDLGAELGDGYGASRRVDGARRIVQHRADKAARTVITTSIGDDCDQGEFVAALASRYEMDIARRLVDPVLSTVIHLRRKEG